MAGFLLWAVAAWVWSAPAPASPASAPQNPRLLAASLQSFMPDPAPIKLAGSQAQASLSLPIAPRLDIQRAVLHLVATSSISLLAPRSQLKIRLDGQVIAQVPLDPARPVILARIELPLRLLKPGFRQLSFAVAQHYTYDCEDPSAPGLWTEINTAQSWVELRGGLGALRPTLAQIDEVFDPKVWGPQVLTVFRPEPVDHNILRWGALAAQAAAMRLSYVPLTVRDAPLGAPSQTAGGELRIDLNRVPEGDAVLVGTVDQLRPYLAPQLAARITGSFLAIRPLDAGSTRFVLIASGKDANEVDRALRALNLLNFPYPDAADAVVQAVETPALPLYARPNMVYPNQRVRFSGLGFGPAEFLGMHGQRDLTFSIPPDLFAPDDALIRMRLRFAYGAGLRDDSALNILLNGRFQSAIPLDSHGGGYFRDYAVAIPIETFKPGTNVITFSAAMMPRITGHCLAINENLHLTLFEDSQIEMPNAAHVTSMPDLSLLQRTGFPYTRQAFGAGSVVVVTEADPDTLAAAWMFAARLAQAAMLPLLDMRWQLGTHDLPMADHVIVVGSVNTLPSELTDNLTLRLGRSSVVPHPVSASPAGLDELGWFGQLWHWISDRLRVRQEPELPEVAWVTTAGVNLGQQAVLVQAELPGRRGAVLTVLTAAQPELLAKRTDELIGAAIWHQISGDLFLWAGPDRFSMQSVGPRFTVGHAGLSSNVSFVFSRHPWFWATVIGLVTLLLALLTLRLLMRFKHRRHAQMRENPEPEEPSS